MEKQDKKKMCSDHLYRYVSVWMEDGSVHDGIVESVDEENVYLAVPMTCDTYQQAPAHGMNPYCGCMPSPCGDYRGFFHTVDMAMADAAALIDWFFHYSH